MSETLKFPRIDIQALRGFAVLLVVLYHTKIVPIEAGYLGVDIFFVISGFLITTLVATGIRRGRFRLSNFYFRRAKRLLPAAYVTFAVTAVLAPWFLNQQELRDFVSQMIGAVTFSGNFVLWQQTGYFEGASDLKPLLHVWSLAIEEQYYFILPAALLFTRPSRWLTGTSVLLVLSLALCVVGGVWKPIATFYLIPTRAWELLIGSVGALWLLRAHTSQPDLVKQVLRISFFPALLCLMWLPFMPFNSAHPGLNAFLVCIATIVVILRNSMWLNTALPTKLLARIGDFSYSLYLVHWPIVAFMRNAWIGSSPELPMNLRSTAFVLSFVLAYLLYRLVEDPIRRSSFTLSKRLVGKTVLTSLLLAMITPVALSVAPSKFDFKALRRANYGFSEACEYQTNFAPKPECQNSSHPTLLIWGDSYAMHLVPGLAGEWKSGVMQATKSACGPFLGLAPREFDRPKQGMFLHKEWAEGCIAFNQSVIEYLRDTASIQTVVLSSPFAIYLATENVEHLTQVGGTYVSSPVSVEAAVASMHRTVDAIRKSGKNVVIVAPPPSLDFDIGGCLERQLSGAVAFGGRPDCVINRAEYEIKRADVLQFLNLVAKDANVSVIRFDPWLCDSDTCKTFMDGTMIYRDGGHLSNAGSVLLAEQMQFGKLVRDGAK